MLRIGIVSFIAAVCVLTLFGWLDGLLDDTAIAGVLTAVLVLTSIGIVSKPFGLTNRRRR